MSLTINSRDEWMSLYDRREEHISEEKWQGFDDQRRPAAIQRREEKIR